MTNLDKKSRDRDGQIWNRRASSSETSCSPAAAAARARARSCLIACVLCVSACRTDNAPTSDARTLDAAACGAVPLQPGVTVAFDGQGNAIMSVATYNAIVKFMDDASAWMQCRQMNP